MRCEIGPHAILRCLVAALALLQAGCGISNYLAVTGPSATMVRPGRAKVTWNVTFDYFHNVVGIETARLQVLTQVNDPSGARFCNGLAGGTECIRDTQDYPEGSLQLRVVSSSSLLTSCDGLRTGVDCAEAFTNVSIDNPDPPPGPASNGANPPYAGDPGDPTGNGRGPPGGGLPPPGGLPPGAGLPNGAPPSPGGFNLPRPPGGPSSPPGGGCSNPRFAAAQTANPVVVASGEMIHQESDASFGCPGEAFLAHRLYRSSERTRRGGFGHGWRFLHEREARIYAGAIGEVDGFGNEVIFQEDSMGGFRVDPGTRASASIDAQGRFVVQKRGGTRFVYDLDTGRLLSSVDLNGNSFALTYGEGGALASIQDPVGRTVRFECAPSSGLTTRMILPDDTAWQFEYDAADQLVSVRDPRGNVTRYEYSPSQVGLMTRRVDALEQSVTWEYDAAERVSRLVNEAGGATTIQYEESPRRTTFTDSLGNVTRYTLDPRGHPVEILWPDGSIWKNTFSPEGLVLSSTDPLDRTISYTYGSDGLLASATGPEGQVQRWTHGSPSGASDSRTNEDESLVQVGYDARSNPLTISDATNRVRSYSYNARGQVLTESDQVGTTVYEYSPRGELVRRTDPLGRTWTSTFDPLSRVLSETDPLGRTETREYWLHGLVSRSIDALGHERLREFDGLLNVAREVDAEGGITEQVWRTINGRQLLVSRTDPEGFVTHNEYDTEGRLVATVDARGARTELTLDPAGRVVARKDALGFDWFTSYNLDGTVHQQIDPLGHVTTFLYDTTGRLHQTVDARGKVRTTLYDPRGRVVGSIDENGESTTFVLDAEGRQTKVVDPEGNTSETFYDLRGIANRVKNARGHETTFLLDDLGRQKETRFPDGGIAKSFWNESGELERSVDPEGRETRFEYDLLGRQTKTIGPSQEETNTLYTEDGRVSAVQDPDGNWTHRRYDKRGLLVESIDALGHTVARAYDGNGNLIELRDENGNATTFRYDLLNRLVAVVDSQGRETTHAYDAAGRRIASTNARGQVTSFGYDELGRLVTKTTPEGVESYAYDDLGRRIRKTNASTDEITLLDRAGREVGRLDVARGFSQGHELDPNGNQVTSTDSLGRTVDRGFDLMDRLTSLASQDGQGFTMAHNLAGQITQRSGEARGVETFTYDASGRLSTVEVRKFDDQSLIVGFAYFYSPGGDRIREIETRPAGVSIETVYEHNARHELIRATVLTPGGASLKGFGDISWTYDPAGNRLTQTKDGVTQSLAYDSLNQLVSIDGRPVQHDLDGNMTREPLDAGRTRIYEWDSQNRMIRTAVAHGSPGSEVLEDVFGFRYDPDSMRITSIEEPDASAPARPRTFEERFLAGGQILEDRRFTEGAESDQSSRRYVRHGLQVLEELRDSVSGATVTTQGTTLYLQDALGSTIGQIDTTPATPGTAQPIRRASESATGDQANGPTSEPAISGDGRFVAFLAFAGTSNLAPGDNNGVPDVYLKDRQTGGIERISVPGYPGMFEGGGGPVRISRDGRYVLFSSSTFNPFPFVRPFLTIRDRQAGTTTRWVGGDYFAADLSDDGRYIAVSSNTNHGSPLDQNGGADVWVFDTQTLAFDLVSHGPSSSGSNHGAFGEPSISADGRYVAFSSSHALVPGDVNGFNDIYVKDRQTGDMILASTTGTGVQANSHSGTPSISSDGRWVAFTSTATNLAPSDTRFTDVFLKDLVTGQLLKVSEGQGTNFSGEASFGPISLSEDGRYVTYTANDFANQVPGDTNGVDDIFLLTRDMATNSTARITVTTSGSQPNAGSGLAAMSQDGAWIAFMSGASNLVADDTNGVQDIFIAQNPELATGGPASVGEARLMSYTPYGEQTAGPGARFTFTGLANENLGGATDSMLAATYRSYRPGVGRWVSRDPAGFIDGTSLYKGFLNEPTRWIDPTGLAVWNHSSFSVYVKPEFGDDPRSLSPFGNDPDLQDGISIPALSPGMVYKSANGVDLTINQDGSVSTSSRANPIAVPGMFIGAALCLPGGLPWLGGGLIAGGLGVNAYSSKNPGGGWQGPSWLKGLHSGLRPDHSWDKLFLTSGLDPKTYTLMSATGAPTPPFGVAP